MGYLQGYDDCDAVNEVIRELRKAREAFPPFNSSHEGWATLYEEVDELWDLVKLNPKKVEGGRAVLKQKMKAEAVQVAAMAIRFIEDVCDKKES